MTNKSKFCGILGSLVIFLLGSDVEASLSPEKGTGVGNDTAVATDSVKYLADMLNNATENNWNNIATTLTRSIIKVNSPNKYASFSAYADMLAKYIAKGHKGAKGLCAVSALLDVLRDTLRRGPTAISSRIMLNIAKALIEAKVVGDSCFYMLLWTEANNDDFCKKLIGLVYAVGDRCLAYGHYDEAGKIILALVKCYNKDTKKFDWAKNALDKGMKLYSILKEEALDPRVRLERAMALMKKKLNGNGQ
ncbi:MAG: hypothetical protein LBT70_02665 [Holosporaceae bacterium]|jgi:hypothetical protein|nr:hypothetical protein [Holosporaceae bacterium]